MADGDVLPGSKLLDPLLVIALLVGCFRSWRRRGLDADLALAGAVVLLSVPIIFFHGTIGFANLAYTTYLVLGCLWILEGVAEGRSSALALGSILLAGAARTRPEGVLTASALGTSLVLAGVYPIMIILIGRWLSRWAFFGLDLSYPPLWGALCLGAIAGMLVTYPFHLWMLRRGEFRWGSEATAEEVSAKGIAWYVKVTLVVLSFVIMLGALFLAMQIA